MSLLTRLEGALSSRAGVLGNEGELARRGHRVRGTLAHACLALTGAAAAAAALSAAAAALPQAARSTACGLPEARPLWIDYGDRFVPFRNELFGRPGVVAAVSWPPTGAELRRLGAKTVYWDMRLNARVGTPSAPADPATIVPRANRLFDYAASVTACSTPWIAFNELFGAQLRTPWSATNRQYRDNVLTLLRTIARRGGHPFLLVSHWPATAGAAGRWWRDAATASDFVHEIYISARQVHAWGPDVGSAYLRRTMARVVHYYTRTGIPARRVGFILGFHTELGTGGRDGLQPAQAWYEVVKLDTLAARRVATRLRVSTIWSWGWGAWDGRLDAESRAAACVYLWTRDSRLCDGPAAAGPGFNTSLTQGQAGGVLRARARRVRFSATTAGPGHARIRISAVPAFARSVLYVQRKVATDRWEVVESVKLDSTASARLLAKLPSGRWALRVVGSPSATGALYAGKLGPVRFVSIT